MRFPVQIFDLFFFCQRCLRTVFIPALFIVALIVPSARAGDIMGKESIVKGLVPVTGESELKPRSINLDIHFKVNSVELTDQAKIQLDILSDALASRALKDSRFAIQGHTDASGSARANKKLSKRHAESVMIYLVKIKKLKIIRFEIKGWGEEKLKNPLAPMSGENRRVEIVNLTPGGSTIKKTGNYEAIQ